MDYLLEEAYEEDISEPRFVQRLIDDDGMSSIEAAFIRGHEEALED